MGGDQRRPFAVRRHTSSCGGRTRSSGKARVGQARAHEVIFVRFSTGFERTKRTRRIKRTKRKKHVESSLAPFGNVLYLAHAAVVPLFL
jgi:hypothetical protein